MLKTRTSIVELVDYERRRVYDESNVKSANGWKD
jgi:hypothetical protein